MSFANAKKKFHYIYNRIISRHRIKRRVGSWFEVDWKIKARNADRKTWVDVYDKSWENWSKQDLAPQDISRISDLAGPCKSLLDAGCGDGYLLDGLKHLTEFWMGIDLSKIALRRARKRFGANSSFTESFIEDLPFADDSFEVVVSAHTLEHVRNLERAVSELKRITSKKLIILVPSQEYLPYTEDYHLHFFTRREDLIKVVGIHNAKCIRYKNPPGDYMYQGDVLLLTADLAKPDRNSN
jgi:SAM-dependent methyltransferase